MKETTLGLDDENVASTIIELLVSNLAIQHTLAEFLTHKLAGADENSEHLYQEVLRRFGTNARKIMESVQIRRGDFDFDGLLGNK